MLSAFTYRHDVMHLLHGGDASFSQTPLTDGMASGVAVTDTLPGTAIFLMVVRGACVRIVLAVDEL